MNLAKSFWYACREMLTGKRMPEALAIERKEPPEPWPARPAPKEKVELCAACWSKIIARSDRLDRIEFVEVKEKAMDHGEPDIANVPMPTACGKCKHLRTNGLHDDSCFAKGAGAIMCRHKNISGTCPDFKQRSPKFNYLTGVWEA